MTVILSFGSLTSFLVIWRLIKNRNLFIEIEGKAAHKAKYGDLFDKLHSNNIISAYWNLL